MGDVATRLSLNIQSFYDMINTGELHMNLIGYFQILIGVLMTGTFVTLTLILLNGYYGKDEKETDEND